MHSGNADVRMRRWLSRFLDPPREYTLLPFWFWNDALDEEEIVRQIDDFAAHGVYGFVIHPRLGLPEEIGFMSDRYLHFCRVAVEQAAAQGMVVHLYDEGMYPSGSACGQVVRANPAHAARCLIVRELPDGQDPDAGPEENLVAVAALPGGRRVAIVDAPSLGKIRGVHYGQDDGEPDQPRAADLLNPEATASFIRHVHERYYQALAPHFGRTVRALFTDEPSLLGRGHRPGALPWTTGLERSLSAALGCDVRPRLVELWHPTGSGTEAFRADVGRALQARLEESYYRPLSEWCAAHGVALTGHPAEPGDIGVLRYFQIPGQDVVWRYVEPGKPSALEGPQSCSAKCGSSAAVHLGRDRNGNEAFGAYGWSFTLDEMEWLTRWLLVRGVNLIWPHAFYYSMRGPRRDERPPDVGPNSAWWAEYRPYADAVRRLCWLLAGGTHCANVAILGWPDALPWAAAKACFERQRDFNYLEMRHLVDGSARVTEEGVRIGPMHYRALILDGARPIDASLAAALGPLLRAGRVASCDGAALEGARPMASAGDLLAWLDRVAPPDLQLTPAEPDLRYRHVSLDGLEIFLLFNEGERPLEASLSFPGLSGPCFLIDPKEPSPALFAQDVPLPLALPAHQMRVVALRREPGLSRANPVIL